VLAGLFARPQLSWRESIAPVFAPTPSLENRAAIALASWPRHYRVGTREIIAAADRRRDGHRRY
jgi:hypothetical protein